MSPIPCPESTDRQPPYWMRKDLPRPSLDPYSSSRDLADPATVVNRVCDSLRKEGAIRVGRDQFTIILNNLGSETSDPAALDVLFAATYDQLRSLAGGIMSSNRPSHTLQPTALVNEAYLRLVRVEEISLQGRAHFINLAARVMRQVLVDYARRRNSAKRGGGWQAVNLTGIGLAAPDNRLDLLLLDEALTRLEAEDARAAQVVELRIFAALKMEEIAGQLGLTRRTVQKDWRYATLWLRRDLCRESAPLTDPSN